MKNVAVISDTHVGSAYGLGHPDFLSEHQKQTIDSPMLYEKYCEVLDWLGKIDIVLHLGDSCESINYKGRGADIKLEETDQIRSTVKLLRMIKGSPKFYMVEGSEYHCGPKKLDELVAEQLGAKVHPHYHTPAPPHHDILIEGVQFNIAHPISISKSTWQYQCYSEDTEALTPSGWKLHDQIRNEQIAVYDPQTDSLYFDYPLNLYSAPYVGKMIHFHSRGFSVLVTPEHKMWLSGYGGWQKRYAKDLATHKHLLFKSVAGFDNQIAPQRPIILAPATCEFVGHEPRNYSQPIEVDDWAEFTGWFLSEGGRQVDPSNSNHQVSFCQRQGTSAQQMEQCFSSLGIKHWSGTDKNGYHRWMFNSKQLWENLAPFGTYSATKHIPREMFTLPNTALQRMFESLILGDGSIDSRTHQPDSYYTVSFALANDVQELATRLGIQSRVALHYIPDNPKHQTMYRVLFKSYNTVTGYPEVVDYSGNVMCFQTRTGLYLTRRPNSVPTIQGNTTPLAREQVLAILNDNPAHIVLRGHAHYFVYCGFTEHFGAVVPGFQTKTPFQGRISPLGEYRVGALKFIVDKEEFDWHRKIWKTKLEVLKA